MSCIYQLKRNGLCRTYNDENFMTFLRDSCACTFNVGLLLKILLCWH